MNQASSHPHAIAGTRARRGLAAATLASLVLAALPGVAMAATSGSTSRASVSPAKWSQNVCVALVSYEHDAAKLESNVNKTIKGLSLSARRDKLVTFLQQITKRSDQAVASLKRAGSPSTTNGDQIASTLLTGYTQIRDGFAALIPTAQQVPTTSAAAFQTAVQGIEGSLNQVDTLSQGTLQQVAQLASPDLNAAFSSQPACRKLNA